MGYKNKNKKRVLPRYFSNQENIEYMQELLTVIEMDDRIKYYAEHYPDEKEILKCLRMAKTYAQKAVDIHRSKKDKDELAYSEYRTRQYQMVIVHTDEAERIKKDMDNSFNYITMPCSQFKLIMSQALNACFDCQLDGDDVKKCIYRKAFADAGVVKGNNAECGYKRGGASSCDR